MYVYGYAYYPPRLHLICLGSSLMFLATITLVPLPLPNLIFPWSGLHLDRGHSVLPVLPSGAAYLQPFVQHLTSASTILRNYVNVFILMHERQFVLCNNMHTTELTILFYLFIYYFFIVHIVVFVLGAFVVASGYWPPQFK